MSSEMLEAGRFRRSLAGFPLSFDSLMKAVLGRRQSTGVPRRFKLRGKR
jgi:hypothetical protein